MNKYLQKNYALFNKEVKADRGFSDGIKKVAKNSTNQYILFGIIMCIVGFLATEKIIPDIIPYSWQSAFAITFTYAIASIGFCLLMGYSGLASLGTGGCIGIGTYAVHYIMVEAKLPLSVAIIVAIAVAIVLGLVIGFISLRIEGIYLVILTLALSEILITVYKASPFPKIELKRMYALVFGQKLPDTMKLAFVMVFLVIIMIITTNLIKSPTGRAMLAMKNSTAAAQAMGLSLIKYRLMAFVISTVYAAITGVLMMMVVGSADATDATGCYALITSLNILAAVIIGGYKSIWGAVFGTFVMFGIETIVFQVVFKKLFEQNEALKDTIPLIITLASGVLVIVIAMFFPGGLAQLLTELKFKISKLFKKMKEAKYGKDLG